MKTNTKKKPKMKQMNSSFLPGAKLFLKGLISNNASYEGAKTTPWWVALIIIFVSTILATIPTMVYYAGVTGHTQAISASNPGLEIVFTDFQKSIVTPGAEINLEIHSVNNPQGEKVNALLDSSDSWSAALGYTDIVTKQYQTPWVHTRSEETASGTPSLETFIDYEVYRIRENVPLEDELSVVNVEVNNLLKGLQPNGEERPLAYYESTTDETGLTTHVVALRNSFTYYSKTFFSSFVVNRSGSLLLQYRNGRYDQLKVGYNLNELGTVMIGDQKVTASQFLAPATGMEGKIMEYQNGVLQNYSKLYDDGYLTTKWNTFWLFTAITYAVFVGFIIILTLIIFLLTRGTKKRPRTQVFSFLDCFKMIAWLSFTPAVIALVGFIAPQYSALFFIIPMTVRAMFFGMKTLGPGGLGGGAPVDQKAANAPLPRGRG